MPSWPSTPKTRPQAPPQPGKPVQPKREDIPQELPQRRRKERE